MSNDVLMVVTSHTKITDQHKTGLWLEEFAAPYNMFREQGYNIRVTSIAGGQVELDPNSVPEEETPKWDEARLQLEDTEQLTKEIVDEGYDAIFLPGGHGAMFDFPDNEALQYALQQFAENDKVIGSVCHGPAGLVNATYEDGTPIVKGKKVNGFTDSEERGMELDDNMPFLLETKLREQGAEFESGDDWADYSVRDGKLITGQNPMSSESTAQKVIEALTEF
ncbi:MULTISPECIES: type 1 glutamine amidotransferase domain-containing protein [Pontibacillus]|uniref:Type 1 glutamine amidotransferase domain-containing protein n=1 Tax=Pontibacillus chungwhensis TaxID=265426 RepID=A0ABY8V0Q5_9BACI|nr:MULTISPECIES: type 1 glutamine amidotransferase domain-containing protein [Pontibacillus]MCD5324505.1 type 1 glutamine amidotransferase domain-containing protein [Pontibacillus sp. HN14]WIF99200.1 type 1 glutamine amidotransferase domain-containing protein [Pontibacillus chungwhensis]